MGAILVRASIFMLPQTQYACDFRRRRTTLA